MKFKTWPVAAAGFAGLLLLIVIANYRSSHVAAAIHAEADRRSIEHHVIDGKLRRLRSAIHFSSIYVRDYLLDVANEHNDEYRQLLGEYKAQGQEMAADLKVLIARPGEMELLESRLDEYWRSLDPLFGWTREDKLRQSANFVRRELVPRREAVLEIAYQIENLNETTLAAERAETEQRYEAFRANQARVLWQSTAIGLIVAAVAVVRLRLLERRSDDQRLSAERAEQQLRQLSQQIVATQEDERKHLSRELHDQIAQVLTALRMELRRLERGREPADLALRGRVTECLSLVDQMFRSIRDLALGLRPSMLDDFGLRPALEWLARDVGRRSGLNVRLDCARDLDDVPDRYRTCVYRIVQEALTNCARHAQATSAVVMVARRGETIELSVSDDGRGLDPIRRHTGLGLRGMEERVKELEGRMVIESDAGAGTLLLVHLPVPIAEVPRESVAG